jgi:hypothetical protein
MSEQYSALCDSTLPKVLRQLSAVHASSQHGISRIHDNVSQTPNGSHYDGRILEGDNLRLGQLIVAGRSSKKDPILTRANPHN